jgi:ribonuclease P protein component
MAGKRFAHTRLGRLRRCGVRVSSGPWAICGDTAPDSGRLVVSLGKIAGNATTRSRIRRIMREVFAERFGVDGRVDVLLLARSSVAPLPRRQVRAGLDGLMGRLCGALARRPVDHKKNA